VPDNLKGLRQKYAMRPALDRPASIDEPSWAVFTEYMYRKRSLSVVAKLTKRTPAQVRRTLFAIDAELPSSSALDSTAALSPRELELAALTKDSPIEALDLSVRSRNALHRLGCKTVGEVNALDLTQSLRQIGSKGKLEVFAALERGGFRHPAMDATPSAEVSRLTHSLERLKLRIQKTLESVAREISALQERLAKVSELQ